MNKKDEPMDRLMQFINSGRHRKEEMPEELSNDLFAWVDARKPTYPDPMEPPWLHYPHIPAGSIGWRMGPGEDYWMIFLSWAKGLSAEDFAKFVEVNPEPEGWEQFYERLRAD